MINIYNIGLIAFTTIGITSMQYTADLALAPIQYTPPSTPRYTHRVSEVYTPSSVHHHLEQVKPCVLLCMEDTLHVDGRSL